ncbi:hypothetical protein LTR08_002613 [Meristemomyces frigidus]|nr:hypothetical protein LTR08_002613 [Meristemomyces frigidus]
MTNSKMSATSHGADESLLLNKIPAEIRNTIWALVAVKDSPIVVSFYKPYIYEPEPALLAVNRQVRSESRSIYYGDNTFEGMDWDSTQRFLEFVDDNRLKLLRRLDGFGSREFLCYSTDILGEGEGKLQWADDVVKGWLKDHAARGLRQDAILVPLPVFRNGRPETEYVPWPQLHEWVWKWAHHTHYFARKNDISIESNGA